MAHAQKLDLDFQRNGRVHLYRRGCQFSRLLAAEVCGSAVVMLDRPVSDTVHDCWLPPPFAFFPFTSPPVRFRVPSHSVSALHIHTHHEQICCHNTDYVRVNGHDRNITLILAKHCIKFPDDGSLVIRNMLEQF